MVLIGLGGCKAGPSKVQTEPGPEPLPMDAEYGLTCPICGDKFPNRGELKRHKQDVHVLCPQCKRLGREMWLIDREEYRAHWQNAHKGVPTTMSFLMGSYVTVVGGGYSLAIYFLGMLI